MRRWCPTDGTQAIELCRPVRQRQSSCRAECGTREYDAQGHMRIDPFDLASIFLLREMIDAVDPRGAPSLRCLQPARLCRSIAILPGSFNPPTAAHVLLAERANA